MSSSGIPDGLSGDLQSTGNMPAQAPTSHLVEILRRIVNCPLR